MRRSTIGMGPMREPARAAPCARIRRVAGAPGVAPDPVSSATVPGELLHINLAAGDGLQINDQRTQVENRAVGIEVDESTSLSGTRVAPRYRAEHRDVARRMASRDSLDLRAPLAKLIER